MKRVLLLTLLCLSFGIFIYARMPSGYSDYYARYKIIPMTYFYDIALFKNGSLNMTDFMKGCYNSSEVSIKWEIKIVLVSSWVYPPLV